MKSKLVLALFFGATLSAGAQKIETNNVKQLNLAKKQGIQAAPGNIN